MVSVFPLFHLTEFVFCCPLGLRDVFTVVSLISSRAYCFPPALLVTCSSVSLSVPHSSSFAFFVIDLPANISFRVLFTHLPVVHCLGTIGGVFVGLRDAHLVVDHTMLPFSVVRQLKFAVRFSRKAIKAHIHGVSAAIVLIVP
jgi:hypothetical protein